MQPGFKYPIYSCKDFTIYFERVLDGPLMIHADYQGKWTKQSKKVFTGIIDDLCSNLKEPIFALPMIDDAKMRKFTKMCNFIKIADFECHDKVVRPLYMWSK